MPERFDDCRALFDGPARQDRRTNLSAMGALEESDGGFDAIRANRAPPGARSDSRQLPPLCGIGVDQEERTEHFFAHERQPNAKM